MQMNSLSAAYRQAIFPAQLARPSAIAQSFRTASAGEAMHTLAPVSKKALQNARVYNNPVHHNMLRFENKQTQTGSQASSSPLIAPLAPDAFADINKENEDFFSSSAALTKNIAYAHFQADQDSGAQAQAASSAAPPATGCNTCSSRQYQDGSHDSGVSFQSPKGMPASTAGVYVAAHEGEHVSRESNRAREDGEQVLEKRVAMQMAFCPDCGRMYVAGGKTTFVTKSNPESGLRVQSLAKLIGQEGEKVNLLL